MRDLLRDLELCEKATPGPWIALPETCGPDGMEVYQEESMGCICIVGDPRPRGENSPTENMHFIAEAREGWPHAIERALKAETLLRDILPMAMWVSCMYKNEPEANPNTHCCIWNEVVKRIQEVLGDE